jgi:hypothetical protein
LHYVKTTVWGTVNLWWAKQSGNSFCQYNSKALSIEKKVPEQAPTVSVSISQQNSLHTIQSSRTNCPRINLKVVDVLWYAGIPQGLEHLCLSLKQFQILQKTVSQTSQSAQQSPVSFVASPLVVWEPMKNHNYHISLSGR